ncbi:MAG: hypothetical protein IKZ75_04680 [Oscillospiraceae bacterium]|nr:hypothetical protein [Oscillospiraceae bacterium]
MKRIWIILLTAALLVLAGCGGKEPVAFSGSKESQPPGMETPVESAKPVENTELQQESTENKANVIEPSEASTTEYVPAVSVTTADENEAPSSEQSSSQPVNEEPESRPPEMGPGSAAPEPQEPPAPSETSPEPVDEPAEEEVYVQEPEPEPDFDIGYWISYAKGAAAGKGLALDSSAVDCWDNPITANPDCIYLERDINARLSRYAGDKDITAVWIWYESIGTNKYLIYIGYA